MNTPLARVLLLWMVAAVLFAATAATGGPAEADHGGPPQSAPMSPVLVGILAALLTLAALGLIALVVRILMRGTRAPE